MTKILTTTGDTSGGGLRTRLQTAALLVVLAIGATFLLNAVLGTAEADAVRAPGAEHEFHGFTQVYERNVAAQAQAVAGQVNAEGFAACVDGMAGQYPCDGIDLLSRVSLTQLGFTFGNDIWGWSDPVTGDDYALMGGIEGTAAVRITDPLQPVVVAMLPTEEFDPNGAFWRDIKVYSDHAYVVSEMVGHGVQVMDLTQLRGLDGSEVVMLENVGLYEGIGSSHNIAIDEDSGVAFMVGSVDGSDAIVCGDGLHMISLTDPANPEFAGCWNAGGYVHDTQCATYTGPDEDHQGKSICVNSIANYMMDNVAGQPIFDNTVAIVDVSDPANPIVLSSEDYGTGLGYSHQGWMTPDQSKFLHGDELDEIFGAVATTTTRVWDISDLDNISLESEIDNGNGAIDHNMYTRGSEVYQSNYMSGLRIRNIDAAGDGELPEAAFFDVFPETDAASFDGGTWSNYAYYPREGLIAVSSMDRGLFVLGRGLDLAAPFSCSSDQGSLSWTNAEQSRYWIYRSLDDGVTYEWIGRTLGDTSFADADAENGALYQVHYEGLPRIACTIAVETPAAVEPEPPVGPEGFACAADGGVLTWSDAGAEKYWIYRSTDGGETYQFAGRTFGATTKRDPQPAVGALYQVHYEAIPRVDCEIISEPAAALLLNCTVEGSTLNWADAEQSKYWVYRSVDGGESYSWIGRTLGETTFTDAAPVDGALYRVHYEGIPRRDCMPAEG